jgi:hypothetical protein
VCRLRHVGSDRVKKWKIAEMHTAKRNGDCY